MSPAAKRGILIGIAAVVLLLVGVKLYQKFTGSPSDKHLVTAIQTALANPKLEVGKPLRTEQPNGDLDVSGTVTAKVTLSEALYVRGDTAEYLNRELNADTTRLGEARAALGGPAGRKIRELAGITEMPDNPLDVSLLRESAAKGTELAFSGSYVAHKASGSWQVQLSGSLQGGAPEGQALESFKGSVLVEKDPATKAKLKELADKYADFEKRVAAAREQYKDILRKEREARLAKLSTLVGQGTLFKGSVTYRHNQSVIPAWLEITEVKGRKFNAVLRTDGGWQDARGIQGEWTADAEAEHLTLLLASRSNQAINGAGPLLEDRDNWNLSLQSKGENTEFEGIANNLSWHLNRVADAEVAAEITELKAPLKSLLDATAVGLVYKGAIVNKYDQSSETAYLRFTKQENEGALVFATIESEEHPSWRRNLRGTLIASPHRADGRPLRLKLAEADRVRRASDGSLFSQGYERVLQLTPSATEIQGEDNGYSLSFTRLSAEDLDKLEQERSARQQQVLAFARSGASYDGSIRDESGFIGNARLRFINVNLEANEVTLMIESRSQPGIHTKFKGAIDPNERLLSVQSVEGTYNKSGRLRVPFFSRDGSFTLSLNLSEEGLTGEISGWRGWTLLFPVKKGYATPPKQLQGKAPAMPQERGAYVLSGDTWQKLPSNGGKVSYGLSAVANQIGGFLKTLRKPTEELGQDKLADLLFEGFDPIPTVDGEQVTILFVGPVDPTNPDLAAKYPELIDYPSMEVAPTYVRNDNKRSVDLVRIAPGVGGFGNRRVAASLDEIGEQQLLLTCTVPLRAGFYAVSVSSAQTPAFEFKVK